MLQSKIAVSFLTVNPQNETIEFAKEIKKLGFDVFIIYDNDKLTFNDEMFIKINDSECIEKCYTNSNISSNSTHIAKNPIAWDKFIYFFCELNTNYDFVWVFEDDCFIPSINAFEKLNLKYNSYDLVTPNNFINKGNQVDWHWREIYPKINPPYAYSMVCASGISKELFKCIKQYQNENNSLFYIEVMFNTLALHNNLSVVSPKELKSIVWMGKWDLNEFLLLPDNIFHPRKDIENFNNLRNEIVEAKINGVIPKNNLPDFLK
jgi:hypothetical protein